MVAPQEAIVALRVVANGAVKKAVVDQLMTHGLTTKSRMYLAEKARVANGATMALQANRTKMATRT